MVGRPRVLIEDWLPVAELGIESRRERAAASALPHSRSFTSGGQGVRSWPRPEWFLPRCCPLGQRISATALLTPLSCSPTRPTRSGVFDFGASLETLSPRSAPSTRPTLPAPS